LRSRAPILAVLFAALTASAAGPVGEQEYDQGVKELAAKDWDKALDRFEAALNADPDNLRYGSDYRQAAILRAQTVHGKEGKPEDFDRPISFFQRLVSQNPSAANAILNYGLAYIDKLPALDYLGRVFAANAALAQFNKTLDLRPSWISYYTRGTSYLFWPKIFDRAKLGVADLETVTNMQSAGAKKPYYVHAWVALGDGYWKLDNLEKARAIWSEGLKEFPDSSALKERLSEQGDDLKAIVREALDPSKRVDTNLKDIWLNP
jgi:tetratricopeptide (TPR) repeat protein